MAKRVGHLGSVSKLPGNLRTMYLSDMPIEVLDFVNAGIVQGMVVGLIRNDKTLGSVKRINWFNNQYRIVLKERAGEMRFSDESETLRLTWNYFNN